MKGMTSIILGCFILLVAGCGNIEDEGPIGSLQNNLKISKPKSWHSKRLAMTRLPDLNQNVYVSVSDNESGLFQSDSSNEFPINAVIDVYIGVRFANYSGIHNVKVDVYLPDGGLYSSKGSDIDFSSRSAYSSDGLIIEVEGHTATIKDIIPVAGTELAILNLTGNYRVEVLLDKHVVAVSTFVLK